MATPEGKTYAMGVGAIPAPAHVVFAALVDDELRPQYNKNWKSNRSVRSFAASGLDDAAGGPTRGVLFGLAHTSFKVAPSPPQAVFHQPLTLSSAGHLPHHGARHGGGDRPDPRRALRRAAPAVRVGECASGGRRRCRGHLLPLQNHTHTQQPLTAAAPLR
jgi:hypothetical protein